MGDFKGIHFNKKTQKEFYEGGAHFNYLELFCKLELLSVEPFKNFIPKPKTRNIVSIKENTNQLNYFNSLRKISNFKTFTLNKKVFSNSNTNLVKLHPYSRNSSQIHLNSIKCIDNEKNNLYLKKKPFDINPVLERRTTIKFRSHVFMLK